MISLTKLSLFILVINNLNLRVKSVTHWVIDQNNEGLIIPLVNRIEVLVCSNFTN